MKGKGNNRRSLVRVFLTNLPPCLPGDCREVVATTIESDLGWLGRLVTDSQEVDGDVRG